MITLTLLVKVITTTCSWQLWPLYFKDLTTGTSINKNDWPKYEEKAPVIHEENLLDKMLAASTTDETDLLISFWKPDFVTVRRNTVSTQTLLGETSCSKLRDPPARKTSNPFAYFVNCVRHGKTDRRTTFRENERRGDGNSGHSAEIGAHWATGKTTMKFRKMRRMDKFRPAYSQLL